MKNKVLYIIIVVLLGIVLFQQCKIIQLNKSLRNMQNFNFINNNDDSYSTEEYVTEYIS